MSVSAKTVMELRAKTGAGMMDCKKALVETNGDIESAITYLREKGISKAAKKAERIAAEGLIFSYVTDNHKTGAILEFNSETDFVAKNKEFLDLGDKLVKKVVEEAPTSLEELNSLKINGKEVKDIITDLIAKIGENMNIRRFERVNAQGFLTDYIHMGGKIGVIVSIRGDFNETNLQKAKDVAMQVAAMDPSFLSQKDVSEEHLSKERDIIRKQLQEEGKPDNIIDKIMHGKMDKYFEENCLIHQKFVKDDKITISEYLGDIEVVEFKRFRLGEGLEKRSNDFAAEVEAQMKG